MVLCNGWSGEVILLSACTQLRRGKSWKLFYGDKCIDANAFYRSPHITLIFQCLLSAKEALRCCSWWPTTINLSATKEENTKKSIAGRLKSWIMLVWALQRKYLTVSGDNPHDDWGSVGCSVLDPQSDGSMKTEWETQTEKAKRWEGTINIHSLSEARQPHN